MLLFYFYFFQAPSLTIRPRPSTKPLPPQLQLQRGMPHHFHRPTPPLPTRLFQIATSQPPSSYPPYPVPRINPWLPAHFSIPSHPSHCDIVHRLSTTQAPMKTWRLYLPAKQLRP